jgi:poly(A) polymerase
MNSVLRGEVSPLTLNAQGLTGVLDGGFSVHLRGFSAVDAYFGFAPLPFAFAETSADLQTLARLFGDIRFPGSDIADCAVRLENPADSSAGGLVRDWYFFCVDRAGHSASFNLLNFFQDIHTKHFLDPFGVYPVLKQLRRGTSPTRQKVMEESWYHCEMVSAGTERNRFLLDAALILSRYDTASPTAHSIPELCSFAEKLNAENPRPELQRIMLSALLASERPDRGLEFLKAAGFVGAYWNELAQLDDAEHSKEFHPEGNAWKHTLETFRYRKAGPLPCGYDLRLSLGLLLHDTGKPLALSSGAKRFDGHAELGLITARRFLERLEFPPELINDTAYLVKNHMLPAALPRLPLSRTRDIMNSPLFPLLMELYRCDESSSFKGLDQYYKSSAAYRQFLKQKKNPYRKISLR